MTGPRRDRPMARPASQPPAQRRGTLTRSEVSSRRRPPGPGGARRGLRVAPWAMLLGLAALVLLGGFLLLRPAIAGFVVGIAESNPQSLTVPFVADLVAEDLGDALTTAAGSDPAPVPFEVPAGATASQVADALYEAGLLSEPLVFEYVAITGGRADSIQAGVYELRATMTPGEILATLQDAPVQTVTVALREGLRLEQITAYLQTLPLGGAVARDFYDLATAPTPELRADFPFLDALPEGRSLEGFLGAGTYEVYPWVSGDDLVRMLLDQWRRLTSEADPLAAAKAGKKDFYEVLTLASIVEREAGVDAERALIAGVYQNRIDRGMLLNADPTVYFAWDTVQLGQLEFARWQEYAFWNPIGRPLAGVDLPEALAGYQTYQRRGLVPGPICTPTVASIQAALRPDTKAGYLYFVLKNDGSRTHAFAKTYEEHRANLKKYGYQ